MKKHDVPRIVPWEPYKAATAAYVKGSHRPNLLPPLIQYQFANSNSDLLTNKNKLHLAGGNSSPRMSSGEVKIYGLSKVRPVGDGKESPSVARNVEVEKDGNADDAKEIKKLKNDLELERQLTGELKRILVATMGDDLTCHVQSLSEDKVRLARMMTKFEAQLTHDQDRAEDLAILADMWRCKFLAMSIRADEMRNQRYRLFNHCKQLQVLLKRFLSADWNQNREKSTSPALEALINEAHAALKIDLSMFMERSPCDEKVCKPVSLTSNITVTCCKHCIAPTERFHVLSQLDHLQSKYTGTGHADTTRWEWLVNQHRDTYASMIGHPDHLSLIAVCENESRARVRFNLLNQMIAPCGPPPEKSPLDE
uniref:Uncharacterized protein n=1 Tax=Setaria digitata TaxID=48799 RepID=A0A915PWB2_9BILA